MKESRSLALMKLPPKTVLSLDGSGTQTLRKEEELIVVTELPLGFHLLSVRAGSASTESIMATNMSMSIGLLILFTEDEDAEMTNTASVSHENATNAYERNFIARQYDQQTEEISSTPLDDLTCKNLYNAIEQQQRNEQPRQIQLVPYKQFTSHTSKSGQGEDLNMAALNENRNVWNHGLTNFISQQVLERHNLTGRGDKIIPGSMDMNDEDEQDIKIKDDDNQIQDGVSMNYMPIPCFDTCTSAHTNQGGGIGPVKVRPQSHRGTRRYLASLSPSKRTAIFTRQYQGTDEGRSLGDYLFQCIQNEYYHGEWEELVGEIQLSFVVFVCCSCLASLEHWRDSIYMLSLVDIDSIISNPKLFETFMATLKHQLSNFDCSIFHDDDFAGGNVFVPAINRIVYKCKVAAAAHRSNMESLEDRNGNEKCWITMNEVAEDLSQLMRISFLDQDQGEPGDGVAIVDTPKDTKRRSDHADGDDDDDDDDGPVMVPMEEVQASIDRSAKTSPHHAYQNDSLRDHKEKYPFLFAAVSGDEDLLMACARILDEQCDVTLVREAAAYLETVEANR